MALATDWTADKTAQALKTALDALNKNNQAAQKNAGSTDLGRYQGARQTARPQNVGRVENASLQKTSPTGGQNAGLSGLSESTLAGLQKYGGEYTPSAAVQTAQDYLYSVMNSKPADFASKYADQIASLYDEIMNRPKFQYDVAKDPLFQQYKNQYMQSGQLAMQDAVGSAAALTGGYGSSWGTTAGFQAYQQYLQALNDRIPELEQRAFDKYQYEGEELRRNMAMSTDLDAIDYSRYRDTVQDWKDDRTFAGNLYGQEQSADLAQWQNMQSYYQNMANMENSDYWNAQDAASKAAQLAESQRQYNADLAYKYYGTDADLAYKYYGTDADTAYRNQQLAQNQSQYESDLAYQQYKSALDEAYRRDTLAQNQSQWAAEQALDQAKFDFQLRQYEDALRQAAGNNSSPSPKKNAVQSAAYSAAMGALAAGLNKNQTVKK